jgi:hypothetical protein
MIEGMDGIEIPLPTSPDEPFSARAIVIPAWLAWVTGFIAITVLGIVVLFVFSWLANRRSRRPPDGP